MFLQTGNKGLNQHHENQIKQTETVHSSSVSVYEDFHPTVHQAAYNVCMIQVLCFMQQQIYKKWKFLTRAGVWHFKVKCCSHSLFFPNSSIVLLSNSLTNDHKLSTKCSPLWTMTFRNTSTAVKCWRYDALAILLHERVGDGLHPINGTDENDWRSAADNEAQLSCVIGQLERVVRIWKWFYNLGSYVRLGTS